MRSISYKKKRDVAEAFGGAMVAYVDAINGDYDQELHPHIPYELTITP